MRDGGRAIDEFGEFAFSAVGGVIFQGLAASEHDNNNEAGEVFADEDGGDDGGEGEDVDAEMAGFEGFDHVDNNSGGDGGGEDND